SRTRRGGLQLHHCAQPLIESRQLSNSGPTTELQFVDGVSNTEIQRSGAANSGERLAGFGDRSPDDGTVSPHHEWRGSGFDGAGRTAGCTTPSGSLFEQ